jgi:glutathione peroxidase-family protein
VAGKTFRQLTTLYDKYSATKGLRILAFPSNQFGLEPFSNADIKKQIVDGYGAKFDLFAKVTLNGESAHPLFKYLKYKQGGIFERFGFTFMKWSFSKFLIDKNGQPVKRYGTVVEPFKIEKDFDKFW